MLILKVILIVIHLVVSLLLVVTILLQSPKGGGLAGSMFGGDMSQTLFGARGAASMLSSLTQYLAGGFLVLSLVISLMSGGARAPESVTQKVLEKSPAANLPSVDDLDIGSGVEGVGSIPMTEEEPMDLSEEAAQTGEAGK